MSDTYVTLHGWVGGDVVLRQAGGYPVLDLRVASTARLKRGGDWVDGDTTWYTVKVWRQLAENIARSVHKGDPVIVHGRLRTEVWHRDGGESSSKLVVDASLVGHDLCRGVSRFTRTGRSEPTTPDITSPPPPGEHGQPSGGDWGAPSTTGTAPPLSGPDAA